MLFLYKNDSLMLNKIDFNKIQAQKWYNGDTLHNLSGFIDDKSNRLIDWVIMRQLGIKSSFCF